MFVIKYKFQIDDFVSTAKPTLVLNEDFHTLVELFEWKEKVKTFSFEVDTFRLHHPPYTNYIVKLVHTVRWLVKPINQ